MPVAALAKVVFFATILILWLEGRAADPAMLLASVDLSLGLGFLVAWRLTPVDSGGDSG